MYAWIIPPFGIEFLIFAFGYIYVIIKSTGNVRTSAILIFVGICLVVGASFVLGIFGPYGQMTIIGLEGLFALLIPCLIILGSMILAKGFFGYT